MLNKKPDTIQGFLSPTKLLSGGNKHSKFNSKASKSPVNTSSYKKPQNSDSKYNSQNQSYLNTSREIENTLEHGNDTTNFSRLTGGENHRLQQVGDRRYESERNIPFDGNEREARTMSNYAYNRKNFSIAEEDYEPQENQRKRTLEEINNRRWDTEKSRSDNNRQSPQNLQKLRNDPTATFRQNYSTILSKPSLPQANLSKSLTSTSEVMTIQCYQLIRKLSKIKQSLQLQIMQLQTLLDNTSKHMDNMDEEFEKVKERILAYTSKCLDTAFTQYKQNMVQWQKYEDFQRKSLVMLQEINEYIYNEEQKLQGGVKKLTYKEVTATAQELERQILYYRQFTEEIAKIREQCVGMRPTLSEDRVKEFQKGLAILCNF